jgi:predicted thioesterase
MKAEAIVTKIEGRKSEVNVEVKVGDRKVFTGSFTCYTLDKHVLDR